MTLYVDDLTISGPTVTEALLYRIKRRIHQCGLRTHKDAVVRAGKPRIVTGVVVRGETLRLRNKQHRSIVDLIDKVAAGQHNLEEKLRGQFGSAASIDPRAVARLKGRYERALMDSAVRLGAASIEKLSS